MANTGYKGWNTLEEYNINTGQATGNTKPNVEGDPDYVAPVYDDVICPIPSLSISPTSKTVTDTPNTFQINISSNETWTAISEQTWMSIDSPNTGTGNGNITVNVSQNTLDNPRVGNIKVSISNQDKFCGVTQDAYTFVGEPVQLTFSPKDFEVCGLSNYSTFYIDGSSIGNSTSLYTDSAGNNYATPNWYSDGIYKRFWNGSAWDGAESLC